MPRGGYGNSTSQEEVHYLTKEDLQRLFNAIQLLEKTKLPIETLDILFRVTYEGGLRISETLGLTKKDVDVHRERLILTSTKGGRVRCVKCKGTGQFKEQVCPKCNGNKKIMKNADGYCTTPLFARLTKLAQEIPNSHDKVFPITRQSAYNIMRRMGEIAGISAYHLRNGEDEVRSNVFCHLLRHSRAVHLLGDGMSLNQVMTKLRHRDISTTSIYLKVCPAEVQKRENEMYAGLLEQPPNRGVAPAEE